ncbi:MAG: diaminopimelate epimerase [Clostridia bacterium]|nr:diaminopimelate epimerase [Clostridia bacterium]
MRFTKMQGTGNDYVYVSLFDEEVRDPAALARLVSQPHFGVGSDGLILIGPSDIADFRMRIFNIDGSEGEMCGNACRCVGKYVYERGLTDRTELTLETGAGERRLSLIVRDGRVERVTVNMGRPELLPAAIPVDLPGDSAVGCPLTVGGAEVTVTCVSMGNPHAVIFTDDLSDALVHRLGPMVEHHPAFPHRTNVEFACVEQPGRLRVRVWERGCGETQACGTGACAVLVAAVLTGRAPREADVTLPGGTIRVSWLADGSVIQTGPADFVFDGELPDSVSEGGKAAC